MGHSGPVMGLIYLYVVMLLSHVDPVHILPSLLKIHLNHLVVGLVLIDLVTIQGITGGTDQTWGECSLGQPIPI